jgi:L,D-transpeptidase YcbB
MCRALVFLCSAAAACQPQSAESNGDVGRLWTPTTASRISGVDLGAVRTTIQTRLRQSPPPAVSSDGWRHVRGLYQTFHGAPLWLGARGLDRRRAVALIDAVRSSRNDAFKLDVFPLDGIAAALTALRSAPQPTAGQLADADVMLTSLYASYSEGLLAGQIDPRTVSQDWHIDPREERVDTALARAIRAATLERGFETLRPREAEYQTLQQQLVRYRALVANGGWPQVPKGRALRPGASESVTRLTALRRRLESEELVPSRGARVEAINATPAVGRTVYDTTLAGGVARFQIRHGIVVDSTLGPETVAALNVPAQYRLGQIAANLERFRWLPRALGSRYILVNVPAFRLQAFDRDTQALEMKVIVGADYEGRNTPVFSDSMQYVVFRPYWDVPDSIAKKEVWSKADTDGDFLARNDFEAVTDHGKQRVRQRPGPKNALGLVKFMFPNDFNIYFHDTPDDQLFAKDVRAFSHGCIRVEQPARLAQFVLGWPEDSVRQQMQSGHDDHRVALPQKIPVYIVYLTTYVKDGALYFGNDLYDRDDALVQAMGSGAVPSAEAERKLLAVRKLAGG